MHKLQTYTRLLKENLWKWFCAYRKDCRIRHASQATRERRVLIFQTHKGVLNEIPELQQVSKSTKLVLTRVVWEINRDCKFVTIMNHEIYEHRWLHWLDPDGSSSSYSSFCNETRSTFNINVQFQHLYQYVSSRTLTNKRIPRTFLQIIRIKLRKECDEFQTQNVWKTIVTELVVGVLNIDCWCTIDNWVLDAILFLKSTWCNPYLHGILVFWKSKLHSRNKVYLRIWYNVDNFQNSLVPSFGRDAHVFFLSYTCTFTCGKWFPNMCIIIRAMI